MNEAQLLKRLQLLKKRPDLAKELSPTELAELVVVVLGYAKNINAQIEAGKLKGKDGDTPKADKDYLSLKTAVKEIEKVLSSSLNTYENKIEKALTKLKNGENGKDAKITDKQLKEIAQLASDFIVIPEVTKIINAEPQTIRNSLELLQGDERLNISAISGVDEKFEEVDKKIEKTNQAIASQGGTNKNLILKMIEENGGGSGTVETIVAGTGISVDSSDPANPIVTATASAPAWGDITGTLSNQTDLQTALDGKVDENSAITGATKTKITYDAKGLVTAGADATTADIADSSNKRYVTDAQLTVIGNTSGTNTGDQDISGKADKSGSLTQFVGNTAWRVFYSNTDGDITELALGADGTFLKSNGATSAPTFATPAGSGDVSKVGTPVNNQIAIWTGDGTIEGDTALTFDTTTDTLAGMSVVQGAATGITFTTTTNGNILIDPAGSGSATLNAGSGGVSVTTDASNANINITPHGTGEVILSTARVSDLTASEMVITDASKNLVSAGVSTYPSLTELTYLKGVTSAIQTQLNAKAPIADPTFTGEIGIGAVNVSETELGILEGATVTTAELNILDGVTATASELNTLDGITATVTELNYTDGVTSAIQTQLNGKQPLDSDLTTIAGLADPNADRILFWDDSAGSYAYLTASTGLTISTTSMTVRSASATVTGIIEIATDAETVTGTDTSRATTPANITARLASPSAIGSTTPSTGKFTSVETTGAIELGNASDTTLSRSAAGVLAVEGVVIPSVSSTNTLTNKRITKRVTSETSSATPTINTDNTDIHRITALAANITSFTTNLTGTPAHGDLLRIEITGTATRTIAWGASFEASTVALPTTTDSTNMLSVGFTWNSATSKWRCIAIS